MNLTLRRVYDTEKYTLGILQLGIHAFTTCEDAFHVPKIPKITRIPAGSYDIDLRRSSPLADRYRARFGDGHEGMIWLQNVRNFEWVYIPCGEY